MNESPVIPVDWCVRVLGCTSTREGVPWLAPGQNHAVGTPRQELSTRFHRLHAGNVGEVTLQCLFRCPPLGRKAVHNPLATDPDRAALVAAVRVSGSLGEDRCPSLLGGSRRQVPRNHEFAGQHAAAPQIPHQELAVETAHAAEVVAAAEKGQSRHVPGTVRPGNLVLYVVVIVRRSPRCLSPSPLSASVHRGQSPRNGRFSSQVRIIGGVTHPGRPGRRRRQPRRIHASRHHDSFPIQYRDTGPAAGFANVPESHRGIAGSRRHNVRVVARPLQCRNPPRMAHQLMGGRPGPYIDQFDLGFEPRPRSDQGVISTRSQMRRYPRGRVFSKGMNPQDGFHFVSVPKQDCSIARTREENTGVGRIPLGIGDGGRMSRW
mmetsp:Transcript_29591/g.69584  ORF Transcript_29591/g.69584 Transcript_29591/m.69584 type:complete len:376 (-) Transcript_29591:1175-2302(-)